MAALEGDTIADHARRVGRLRLHHREVPLASPPLQPLRAPAPARPPSVAATSVATTSQDQNRSGIQVIDNREVVLAREYPSPVAEPSVAITKRNEILVTANWLAALSKDNGLTFTSLRPRALFPQTTSGQPFCCDQVAVYDERRDLLIWLLQYSTETSLGHIKPNIHRIAVAKGSDIVDGKWQYYDLSPVALGNWQDEWFDFPDLSVSDDYLYLTSNLFGTASNRFTRSIVLRLPLEKLASYSAGTGQFLSPPEDNGWRAGSLRPAQGFDNASDGSTTVMYWGANRDIATLRVFWWAEADNTIHCKDISVDEWSGARRQAPGPRPGPGVVGRDWLGRNDGRITAAWHTGSELGFAWTGAQSVNPRFPFPHARVLIVEKATLHSVTPRIWQPHIWNENYAFAYPAIAPNRTGNVAISLAFGGGGQHHPSHAVGILRRETSADTVNFSWDLRRTAQGRVGPLENVWGDYLAVRSRPDGTWITVGTTAKADVAGGQPVTDIGLHLVQFGMRSGVASTVQAEPADSSPAIVAAADEMVATYLQRGADTSELRQRLEILKQQIVQYTPSITPATPTRPPLGDLPPSVRNRSERDLARTHLPVPLDTPQQPLSADAHQTTLSRLSQQLLILETLLNRGTRDSAAEQAAVAAIELEASRLRNAVRTP